MAVTLVIVLAAGGAGGAFYYKKKTAMKMPVETKQAQTVPSRSEIEEVLKRYSGPG